MITSPFPCGESRIQFQLRFEAARRHGRRAVQLLAAVGFVFGFAGGLLLPTGAQAFGAPELTCGRSYDLVKSLLKRHISYRELNPELRERAIDSYVNSIDPSNALFLSSEIDHLKLQLRGVFFGMQNDECEVLDQLHADLVKRYQRMEDEVRAQVSDPNYAIDTSVELILDPDKRGHPPTEEARKKLVQSLVHFQMSNYMDGDMDMAKAKQKLIHRYELMTKRVREMEPRDTYGNFLNAFAGSLDPHSNYYPPEEVEDFEIQMSLSLDGIGVALSSRDGYSIVERVIPGGATDKAKALEPGDKIIAVAQEGEEPVDIVDMALRDVVSIIRGKRGTKVRLTVLRKSDTTQRFDVDIVRDQVTIEDAAATLEFREVEVGGEKKKLAILDLPTFYGDADPAKRQSGRDVRDLLRQVHEQKADGLLLDLSRNGGGKLESSVEIAGLFIRKGGVVAVKNVFQEVQVLEDQDQDIVYDGPLVILTSRLTASASEIVAGAMKDYGRAVIVGDDHTFGKGTVQSFIHQPGRLGAIKVTTALFFRPGGASTQHEGVAADVVLPSVFATDDLGERYTPYSLKSQRIPPFIQKPVTLSSNRPSDWPPLSPDLIAELKRRSAIRVNASEQFAKIKEKLAKQASRDDVVRLDELIREREEAEAEAKHDAEATTSDSSAAPSDAKDKGAGATPAPDGAEAKDSGPTTGGDEPDSEAYNEEEAKETPQREEALNVLADLVELEEMDRTTWHAPQSASRLESLSSQP